MPMIAATSARVALLPAGLLGGVLLAGLLASPLPVHGQSAGEPAQASPASSSTRGISAHAASEAALEQLRPVAASGAEQDARPEQSAPSSSDAAVAAVQAPADVAEQAVAGSLPPERGVLFKVTPPQAGVLPAQAVQESAVEGAGMAPAVAPAAMEPPKPSYLLGTIHFGTPEEQGIDYAVLEQLLAQADTFVNEVDVESAWSSDYDQYRWLPEETPLGGMIGEDDLGMAHALLPAVRLQDMQRMKPWAVLALLEARGESGGDATMDARLQQIASGAGKRLAHLETLEQQLRALDCVPAAEHAQVLDERLHKSWVLRIESAEAMAFYRSRNLDSWLASIDRMDGLSDAARAVEQRSRACLLEDRNAQWIGQLETLFQDGPCFVAVGAVHLVGSQGLIALLRRNGYRVEVVPL